MFIRYEVIIELPVIIFHLLHEGSFEKFINVILDKQRVSEDVHDLNDWAANLMVMFNDTNEEVGTDGRVNLYSDSILSCTPEFIDFEVLLKPLEEQFYLTMVLVRSATCCTVSSIALVRNMNSQL